MSDARCPFIGGEVCGTLRDADDALAACRWEAGVQIRSLEAEIKRLREGIEREAKALEDAAEVWTYWGGLIHKAVTKELISGAAVLRALLAGEEER